jgi:type VI secretion system protein ImpA
MTQKPTSPGQEAGASPASAQHDWMTPVSEAEPCGPDLEYDQDFVVLFSRTETAQDVQYGNFVGTPDPVDWGEVDRDCRRLMIRCKDIRVAVLFVRCRAHLAGAAGLSEGLALLAAWLETFPDTIHPLPGPDDEPEAVQEMRANALRALTDPDGLLADVREIVLVKSTLARLQVRDVERAFAIPHPADALAPDSVALQLRDMYTQQPALMADFNHAAEKLGAIDAWCASHLEANQPDLSPLVRLLQLLHGHAPAPQARRNIPRPEPAIDRTDSADKADKTGKTGNAEKTDMEDTKVPGTPDHADENGPLHVESLHTSSNTEPDSREAALALIRSARQWFETYEPSSPIPVLLQRAEQFVGKRYAQAMRAIPPDLLTQWETERNS